MSDDILTELMRTFFIPRHPKPLEFNQTTAWVHPAYVMGRVDVTLAAPVPCKITDSGFMRGFSFPLNNGYMVPMFTIHG